MTELNPPVQNNYTWERTYYNRLPRTKYKSSRQRVRTNFIDVENNHEKKMYNNRNVVPVGSYETVYISDKKSSEQNDSNQKVLTGLPSGAGNQSIDEKQYKNPLPASTHLNFEGTIDLLRVKAREYQSFESAWRERSCYLKKTNTFLVPHSFISKRQKAIQEDLELKFLSSISTGNVLVNRNAERVYTFLRWVQSSEKIVWPGLLAEAGFYFTGQENIVRCFKCNITTSIENWLKTENPKQAHARINPDCAFVLSGFYEEPILTKDVNKTDRQLETQKDDIQKGSCTSATNSVSASSNTEFDNAATNNQEYKHTSALETDGSTRSTSAMETSSYDTGDNLSVADSMRSQLGIGASSQVELRYPGFLAYGSRVSTFSTWNFSDKQKPVLLAEAGFFYTGETDIVRCFCCDLGLAEWDPKDDPWVEHGRHSPDCWFLKKQKGAQYIGEIQLKWKKIYNPKHAAFNDKESRIATFGAAWRTDIEQTSEVLAEAGFFYTGEEDVVRCHYCDGGLRNWEPGDDPWEEHTRWFPFCKYVIKMKGRDYIEQIRRQTQEREQENAQIQQDRGNLRESMDSSTISTLREIGFSDEQIQYGITEFKRQKGNKKITVEAVTEIIFEKPSAIISPFSAKTVKEEEPAEKDPTKLLATNRKLKEQFLCTRCKTNESCILFVNCGHRVTCEQCSESMGYCPQCDVKIKNRMKTFIA